MVVAAVVAYILIWFALAEQARARLESWAAERRAHGWTVAWDDLHSSGFPWRLTLGLEQPRLARPDGLGWSGPVLTLWSHPWRPDLIHVEGRGAQRLEGGGGVLALEVERFAATLGRGSVEAHAHGIAGAEVAVADLGVSIAALPMQKDASERTASWRFALSARDITLPPAAGPGGTVALAELVGRVLGPVPDAPPVAALAQWSRQGGTVELDQVALNWPPVAVEGSGTAALDPAGQPLLALSAQVRGLDVLMDRLAGDGLLDPGAARVAKTILGLMARPDSRGRPAVPVPITVQDGALFVGPARMAAVPAIPWADFPGR